MAERLLDKHQSRGLGVYRCFLVYYSYPRLVFATFPGWRVSGFSSFPLSYQPARDLVRRYNAPRTRYTVTTQNSDAWRKVMFYMTPPPRPDDWTPLIFQGGEQVEAPMSIGVSMDFKQRPYMGDHFMPYDSASMGHGWNRLDRIMSWIPRFHSVSATYLETYPAEMG